jgi:hypothetical protein
MTSHWKELWSQDEQRARRGEEEGERGEGTTERTGARYELRHQDKKIERIGWVKSTTRKEGSEQEAAEGFSRF